MNKEQLIFEVKRSMVDMLSHHYTETYFIATKSNSNIIYYLLDKDTPVKQVKEFFKNKKVLASMKLSMDTNIYKEFIEKFYSESKLELIRDYEAYYQYLLDEDHYVNYDIDYLLLTYFEKKSKALYRKTLKTIIDKEFEKFSKTEVFKQFVKDLEDNFTITKEDLLQKCLPISFGEEFVKRMFALAKLNNIELIVREKKGNKQ